MAYVSQEMKKELAPAIKAVLKKYNVKASISVYNHSTICVNIKSGPIDFISEANVPVSRRGKFRMLHKGLSQC